MLSAYHFSECFSYGDKKNLEKNWILKYKFQYYSIWFRGVFDDTQVMRWQGLFLDIGDNSKIETKVYSLLTDFVIQWVH